MKIYIELLVLFILIAVPSFWYLWFKWSGNRLIMKYNKDKNPVKDGEIKVSSN